MDRRTLMAGLVGTTALSSFPDEGGHAANAYYEIRIWHLQNSSEKQADRLADYLQHGWGPSLAAAGAKLAGAFSVTIGPGAPSYVTLTQYSSLASFGDVGEKLKTDAKHRQALEQLSAGNGLPFVRVESSLLRAFDAMPQSAPPPENGSTPRVFELRIYESQSYAALAKKVAMFNGGEVQIFQRLGFRPVFFGETVVGPKSPNLMYMLSYENLGSRDRLWQTFIANPAWKELSSRPGLSDAEIVANITNTILSPLAFSSIR